MFWAAAEATILVWGPVAGRERRWDRASFRVDFRVRVSGEVVGRELIWKVKSFVGHCGMNQSVLSEGLGGESAFAQNSYEIEIVSVTDL